MEIGYCDVKDVVVVVVIYGVVVVSDLLDDGCVVDDGDINDVVVMGFVVVTYTTSNLAMA